MKLSDAITPSEALNSLTFLLAVISSSQDMQDWMCRSEPISNITSMLERVEQNLSLLVPCSDITRATASGAIPVPATNMSTPVVSPIVDRPSLIDSDSSDFADYHDQLASLLIRMLLNDPARPALQSMASIIWRGMLVKNISFLPLLCKLIGSKHMSLSFMSLRVVLCLLAVSPNNAVCLDSSGITQSVLTALVNLLFRGKISSEQSKILSTVSTGKTYQSIFILNNKIEEAPMSLSSDFVQLVVMLLETLQMFAACFANRDTSIPVLLLWLTTAAWISPDGGDSADEDLKYRCSNCETETATKQCMSER
ncbi:hypothetical protein EON65_05885 [archaeon]|nr:MAG: hypothetical protein EON65_05885 [archaeon]